MTTATALPAGHARRNLAIVAVAAVTALGLVFFMISSVTGAAWTDTTDNTGNSWATGTVSLTDDDLGVTMFTVDDMVPGEVVENSITVTNASSVPLDVRLYSDTLVDTDLLAQHLNLKIGTTAGAGDIYDGTLLAFATTFVDFANGTAVIDLAAAGTQTYHFWVELDSATLDTFQNTSAGLDFVWEGQTQ
ncbi:MAG: TasA family protein [Egibacteraceae bacterium]